MKYVCNGVNQVFDEWMENVWGPNVSKEFLYVSDAILLWRQQNFVIGCIRSSSEDICEDMKYWTAGQWAQWTCGRSQISLWRKQKCAITLRALRFWEKFVMFETVWQKPKHWNTAIDGRRSTFLLQIGIALVRHRRCDGKNRTLLSMISCT